MNKRYQIDRHILPLSPLNHTACLDLRTPFYQSFIPIHTNCQPARQIPLVMRRSVSYFSVDRRYRCSPVFGCSHRLSRTVGDVRRLLAILQIVASKINRYNLHRTKS